MLTLLYSTLHHISHTTAFLAVTTSSSSLVAVRRRRSNLTTQTEDGELGFVEDSEELLATVDLPMTENEIATRPYKSRLNYKTLSVFMIICVLCIGLQFVCFIFILRTHIHTLIYILILPNTFNDCSYFYCINTVKGKTTTSRTTTTFHPFSLMSSH